jgi:nitrite reductase (NADH) small subunit
MNDWTEIATFDDIPRQGARVVEFDTARIAVFRTLTDEIHAVLDKCPHRGGPLSQGIVHGGQVTCPLHSWKIDLATGEAVLPDKGCARTYATKVEGGKVFLRLA